LLDMTALTGVHPAVLAAPVVLGRGAVIGTSWLRAVNDFAVVD
jgi:hypothetical protein